MLLQHSSYNVRLYENSTQNNESSRMKTKTSSSTTIGKTEDEINKLIRKDCSTFEIGEEVWVLKSKKLFAKAKVIELPVQEDNNNNNEHFGKYLVQYKDNSTYHCKPDNLLKIFKKTTVDSPNILIVCKTTSDYRRLARTQLTKEDVIIEIGSAQGVCTNYIEKYCKKVIGIDKSKEYIEMSRKNYPSLEFICLDILESKEEFINLSKELGVSKIYIDINGNRLLPTVLQALEIIQKEVKPEVVVVKSTELYQYFVNNIDC
ncbi:hypothetical protein ABK040_012878 [Willaertia magna]